MTHFSVYRILIGPPKLKLSTITDPFKGSGRRLLELCASKDIFFDTKDIILRSPTTMVLSHKSSPSNKLAYKGILTDFMLLFEGPKSINHPGLWKDEATCSANNQV